MNDIEAAVAAPGLQRACQLAHQSAGIFEEETRGGPCLAADPVAEDVDAIDHFLRLRVPSHSRADDRDIMTGITQGAGLLPNPPVEGDREVFHDDEHSGALRSQAARIQRGDGGLSR